MNGLEALKLMEQGKILESEMESTGEVFLNKIEDNKMWWLFDYEYEDGEWKEEDSFNPTLEYKEYVEPKPVTGWERVKSDGEKFNIISLRGINNLWELEDRTSNEFYDKANYFSMKEKAEEIDFKQTLFRKLQRFSDENGGNGIDWNDFEKGKHFIYYNHNANRLVIDNFCSRQSQGVVYFVSREIAEQAIELFHDELIKYFTM